MKKYIIISGLDFYDNNRGTAALGYGSIGFLENEGFLTANSILVRFRHGHKNTFLLPRNIKRSTIFTDSHNYEYWEVPTSRLERKLLQYMKILLPCSVFSTILKNCLFVAALNGGDGFSDIYGSHIFKSRLVDTRIAIGRNIPLIIMPQTIGPFETSSCLSTAEHILKYAKKIYIRDDKFVGTLKELGLSYVLTKDLSYFMYPKPLDIFIKSNAIGINVSGLAYSNSFCGFEGQFDNYKHLILLIINKFRSLGNPVYLIPHSYNYNEPERNNDDLVACRGIMNCLDDVTDVQIIDMDLIAPEIKFVISKMSYFIGTRMHANFASIFTGVPLYGLAYSYKFEGAFKANGVYDNNITLINNITLEDCDKAVENIMIHYSKFHNNKEQ